MNPKTALAKARRSGKQVNNAVNQLKSALSFRKKISKYWPIILLAIVFDVFASIPYVSIIFNLAFGAILFLVFGPKKGKGNDNLLGIVLPMALGSAVDWILSFLPVNLAAALFRIALTDESE